MSRRRGNIYRRKDGRWEGRYVKACREDGKKLYGSVYGRTYGEAKERLLCISEERKIEYTPIDPAFFEEVAGRWLREMEPNIKPSTAVKYRNVLKKYLYPVFSGEPVEKITNEAVLNYCNALLAGGGDDEKGLTPKTVADTLSVLRSILQFASSKGIRINCDGRQVKVRQKQKELRVLSKKEQQALIQVLCKDLERGNVGILISLFTGLRLGEVCALRWDDVSFKEKTIHVYKTMQRIQVEGKSDRKTEVVVTAPKSDCSIREVPMPNELVRILKVYRNNESGYVLTNSRFSFIEPRSLQNQFKRVLVQCEIDLANYHILRHTFATRCVEIGFDVKSLSEILGHSNVNITMNRYVHPSMELKSKNMQRLSVFFSAEPRQKSS